MNTINNIVSNIAAAQLSVQEQLVNMYRNDADKLLADMHFFAKRYFDKYKCEEEFAGTRVAIIEYNNQVDRLIDTMRFEDLEMLMLVMEKEVFRIQQFVPRVSRYTAK